MRIGTRSPRSVESIALLALIALAVVGSLLLIGVVGGAGPRGADGPADEGIQGVAAVSVLPGVWPPEAERELLDLLLLGDFFPLHVAACVLEDVQAHVSHAQYEEYRARFGTTAANPVYGRFIGQAMETCAIPPRE